MNGSILIVDDDREMVATLEADLSRRGLATSGVTSAREALVKLSEQDFDVVLTDMRMPEMDGLELCKRVAADFPDVLIVLLTAFGSERAAIKSIRAGAYDFITKPVEMEVLALTLERALSRRRLLERIRRLDSVEASTYSGMLGESKCMRELFDSMERVARTESSVVICGESGTGKEMVARALHRRSSRRERKFVAVNCAALAGGLLESELFGHVRGAFTDARVGRKGLFVEASGGTLFLDEVAEIPLSLQPKLLRALEERKARPVGSDSEVEFDVRIVVATNKDLGEQCEKGLFREDLYYRLNVIELDLPPLRSRGNDILLLANHFMNSLAQKAQKNLVAISEEVSAKLLNYRWPGNVRELKNTVERAVALAREDRITLTELPQNIVEYKESTSAFWPKELSSLKTLTEVEQDYIDYVLEAMNGNRTRAAKVLGIDRKTLYRKLVSREE